MDDLTPMDYFWAYLTLPGVRTAVLTSVLLVWAIVRTIRANRSSAPGQRREEVSSSARITVLRVTAASAALVWLGTDLSRLLGHVDDRAIVWLPLQSPAARLIGGLLPLLLVLFGLIGAQFARNGRPSQASLGGRLRLPTARRGWSMELSRSELIVGITLPGLLVLLAVWAGNGSEPGEDGWITQRVLAGSQFASSSTSTFGWSYGIPTVLLLILAVGAAVLLLSRTNRSPLPSDPVERSDEAGRRGTVSWATARLLAGSVLLALSWAFSLIGLEARTVLGMGTRIGGVWTEFRWESNIGGLTDLLLAASFLSGICGAAVLIAVAFGWRLRVRGARAGRASAAQNPEAFAPVAAFDAAAGAGEPR